MIVGASEGWDMSFDVPSAGSQESWYAVVQNLSNSAPNPSSFGSVWSKRQLDPRRHFPRTRNWMQKGLLLCSGNF
jgi:hypothetical protein